MKQFGKLFNQPLLVVVTVMLVAALLVPYSASAMLALQTYDFNSCSLPAGWTLENPTSITHPVTATAVTEGAYTGESYLKLSMSGGTYASITTGNIRAPRLMTSITDTDFTVEAKFLAPQISTTTGYKIEGLLFRDSAEAENVKWLRVDFNSVNNVINSYITVLRSDSVGYISGSKHDIEPVAQLGTGTTTGPILIRVNYVQATGAWTVTYTMNGAQTVFTFNETEFTDFGTFAPNSMGIFVANNDTDKQAHETRVDYIHVIGTTLDDDATKLTINTVGSGTVNRTSCTGNVVGLQAVPGVGASFIGWSGADTNNANLTTTVTMNDSKTVTATFTGGAVLDEKLYLPIVAK